MDKYMERDQFQHWFSEKGNYLEHFFERFNVYRTKLDFSIESLAFVEKLLLEDYTKVEEALAPKEAKKLNEFAIYIGEVALRNFGGKWDIELDEDNVYYGLPIITDYCEKPTPECPLTLITTAIHRRKGDFIKKLVAKMSTE